MKNKLKRSVQISIPPQNTLIINDELCVDCGVAPEQEKDRNNEDSESYKTKK